MGRFGSVCELENLFVYLYFSRNCECNNVLFFLSYMCSDCAVEGDMIVITPLVDVVNASVLIKQCNV